MQHSAATELEHAIKLVGRSPRLYHPERSTPIRWRHTADLGATSTRPRSELVEELLVAEASRSLIRHGDDCLLVSRSPDLRLIRERNERAPLRVV